jgi:CxxC-x17-CxxC domain-containing protein
MKKQSKNEPDVVIMITKLQEQVTQLDRKLDSLISKCSTQPSGAGPGPRPSAQHPQHDHQKSRPMYQITCADCKKDCEIPFKPTGDRPVYCQECFRRRKAANNVKAMPDDKPKAMPPAPTVISAAAAILQPSAKGQKKPAVSKKPAPKKKSPAKKKK